MKWYALLFKYAGKWHKDVFLRQDTEDWSEESKRCWLIEATRFAVERQGLRKEGLNTVLEVQAFEIVAEKKQDGSGQIGFVPVPMYAIDTVHLIDGKA